MRARDFRSQAWSAMNGKWATLALITLLVSLIEGGLAGLSIIGVGAIVLLLVTGPLMLGTTIISLKVMRGNYVAVGDMFLGFKNFGNAFLLALLNEIFVFLWSLLLIVPGIIKAYAYRMSFYILADNPDMDANTARIRSIEMMKGNKWRLFCLDLSFIGWLILCMLTLGILSFWVMPYMQCSTAAFYQDLIRERNNMQNATPNAAPEQPVEPFAESAPAQSDNSDLELGNGNNEENK